MQKIIGVKRHGDKDIYYVKSQEDYKIGQKLVVDFDDFQTIANVTNANANVPLEAVNKDVKIIKKANEKDLLRFEELKKKAKEQMPMLKKKSLELGLIMKFIYAEYSLDHSKIIIVFSSEDRVDFRQFLKDIALVLKTRIELKQIGQRDEVKVIGGVGPCGEPCCCARFLDDFAHVTVKMAKVQGLSLSPTKINGICGRLMCCLAYEVNGYEEILAKMPKVGSEINSPNGKGIVVYNDILRERVSIKRQAEGDSFVVEDFALEELIGQKNSKSIEIKKQQKETIQIQNENKVEETKEEKTEKENHKKFKKHFKFKKNKNSN